MYNHVLSSSYAFSESLEFVVFIIEKTTLKNLSEKEHMQSKKWRIWSPWKNYSLPTTNFLKIYFSIDDLY